jgi:acetyl-CoA synthetase
MTDETHLVLQQNVHNTLMTEKQYHEWYHRSLQDPEGFWSEQAKKYITWFQEWKTVLSGECDLFNTHWFQGAKLNASYNCLDRHLTTRASQPAIIWEGDNPEESRILTYQELYEQVCRFARALQHQDIKKGDRVCIYLPMIPEAAIALLACARIGAVHSVVFGGFSADALKTRILDADCRIVITANEAIRGNRITPLKNNVDIAIRECPDVRRVIVIKRTEGEILWNNKRDVWYHDIIAEEKAECTAEIMDAEDPLFILYTSGSTGKPKGILHSTGGYLLYVAMTHQLVFDYRDREIYWCTADIGWITGHSYSVYGPLANGATTLMFEGVPHYPTPARFWEVVDKHKVNIFYTAPTAIRALRREGNDWVTQTSRKTLRILGSVGEPINPEAWNWYYDIVGEKRCPIVDTWWQTETGGIMITALPGVTPLKAGSASWPFFGIAPLVVDDEGNPVPDGKMGKLVIDKPWPGILQAIYKNPERFVNAYFKEFPGRYLTGDLAYRDVDGYFWISGRSDDVLKISGHRIGTQEVESALITHPAVSEAAVVAIPHLIKGQGIYAYVTLKVDIRPSDSLKSELLQTVRNSIGAIAIPEQIQWAEGLPKTRSGKIMRRLLRKIANNDLEDLGDLTTLADPGVVDELIKKNNS